MRGHLEVSYNEDVEKLVESEEFTNFYNSLSEQEKMKRIAIDTINRYNFEKLNDLPLEVNVKKENSDYSSNKKDDNDLLDLDSMPLEYENKKTR